MTFTNLAKRQLSTIKEHQAVINNKPPACLALLYEFNKNLIAKHSLLNSNRCYSRDPSSPHTSHLNVSNICGSTFSYTNLATPLAPVFKDKDRLPKLQVIESNHRDSRSSPVETGVSRSSDVDFTPNKLSIEGYYYFHVTSKSHVDAHILQRDEVKLIFERECLHYARVFEIAITNYCIMDNHFHLKLGIPAAGISFEEARKRCAKAIGCIKQQFTNRFKVWYNIEYRREKGHRIPKLGGGSMWSGTLHIALITDDNYQAACTLYVEANRIKVSAAELIEKLDEPPQAQNKCINDGFGFAPKYNELLKQLLDNKFQSAQAYLNEELRHNTALTDGLDGVWAPPEEVEKLWHIPASKLPTDYRKVHVNQERRILKLTPTSERTYHMTPFLKRLGSTPAIRQQNFAQLLLISCWKSRQAPCSDSTGKIVFSFQPGLYF